MLGAVFFLLTAFVFIKYFVGLINLPIQAALVVLPFVVVPKPLAPPETAGLFSWSAYLMAGGLAFLIYAMLAL